VRIPAKSTVHAVLDRHGLVKRAKTRRNKAMGTTLADVSHPNAFGAPISRESSVSATEITVTP
jgi:hypothetical protein